MVLSRTARRTRRLVAVAAFTLVALAPTAASAAPSSAPGQGKKAEAPADGSVTTQGLSWLGLSWL